MTYLLDIGIVLFFLGGGRLRRRSHLDVSVRNQPQNGSGGERKGHNMRDNREVRRRKLGIGRK